MIPPKADESGPTTNPTRLYHLVKQAHRTETDFRSNNELVQMGVKPPMKAAPTAEEERRRSAPSAWDSVDKARQLAEAMPKIGDYVAELDPSLWKDVQLEATESGHYLMWGDADSIASGEIWPRLRVKETPA
jgi:hypothetical protein